MPLLAVAGLGIVVAALVALLLLYAAKLLGQFIGQLVPDWHLPGFGSIRSAVLNTINSALAAVSSTLAAAVTPVENWLLAPFHVMWHMFSVVYSGFASAYHAILATYHYAQHLYNLAIKWIESRYQQAIHFAQHVYNLAVSYAFRLYTDAIHLAQHLYNVTVAYAFRLYSDAVHIAEHLYNLAAGYAFKLYSDAIHFTEHVYNVVEVDISAAYRGAVATAQHLYNLARADALRWAQAAEADANAYASAVTAAAAKVIATDITVPVEQAWVAIRDDVAAIEQILGADLPDVQAIVKRLDIARVADIATAAGALAAVDVLVLRYLRDCGIPGCKSLSGLIKDLPRLFSLVEGAAFLAFLIDMVRDPAGTANSVSDVVSPIVTDTTRAFAGLLGLN